MTFQPPVLRSCRPEKSAHRHVPWTSLAAPGVALFRSPSSQLGLPQELPAADADVADAHHAQGGGGGDAAGGTARGGRGADRGLARLPGTAGAAGGK